MYFIFEGADGIGKTTLAKNFAKAIGAKYTYEPFGHTDATMALRKQALTHTVPRIAREYLLLANRDLGFQDLTKWLSEGDVVTDRSIISGMVYALMEGFEYDDWSLMARPLLNSPIYRGAHVILCDNTEYKNKENPEDRYDGRGKEFHAEVSGTFQGALDYLRMSRGVWKHHQMVEHRYTIDFNLPEKENADRLLKQVEKTKIAHDNSMKDQFNSLA